MNKKQQKHEMLITFYAHAKEYRKAAPQKQPAPVNFIKASANVPAAIWRTGRLLKEKISSLHMQHYLLLWRSKG